MSGSMDFGVASPIPHWAIHLSLTPHSSLFFSGETNKYVIFGRTWCYWTFLSDFIWAWVSVIGFMGFYIMGYCWWPVVLSEKETDVTLLYDDASVVTRCPPDRRWRVSQFWYQSGVPSRFRPGWRSGDSVFIGFQRCFCFFLKKYLLIYFEILLAPFCPLITNSNVSFYDDE